MSVKGYNPGVMATKHTARWWIEEIGVLVLYPFALLLGFLGLVILAYVGWFLTVGWISALWD